MMGRTCVEPSDIRSKSSKFICNPSPLPSANAPLDEPEGKSPRAVRVPRHIPDLHT